MYIVDLIKQANRNLWSSKIRTGLTIAAIFVGAFILILTLSVGEGVKNFVSTQTEGFTLKNIMAVSRTSNNILELTGIGDTPPEYKDQSGLLGIQLLSLNDIEEVSSVEGVEKVIPFYRFNIKYFEANNKKFTTFTNIYSERMDLEVSAGTLDDFDPAIDAVVGYGFIKSFGVDDPSEIVGEKLKIVIEDGIRNEREFEVNIKAVLKNSFLLNSFMLVGDEFAKQAFEFQTFGAGNGIDSNQLLDLIQDRFTPEEISSLTNQYSSLIEQFMGQSVQDSDGIFIQAFVYFPLDLSEEEFESKKQELKDLGYTVADAEERRATFTSLITNLQIALGGFSLIAIIAASFGVVNTLLMSIYERTKEIGLMKALGMKDRTVFMLLAIEASVIGFWGSLFGTIGSIILGLILNKVLGDSILESFEGFNLILFSPIQIAFVIFGIIVVTFLAGTLPAIKAMRLNPIDALRYE